MKKSIKDTSPDFFKDKRVFVRVDFNVPMGKNSIIMDDSRIRAALPTIQCLAKQGAKVIIGSHLGRPKGQVIEALRLTAVAHRLSELIDRPVIKINDCIGNEVDQAIHQLRPGDILVLENLRFYKEETENDTAFAQKLAGYADYFVNDAFGTVHRAHASTEGIAKFIPSFAGFLVEKEIEFLEKTIFSPQRPFVAIIGGAKISTKIGVLQHLLNKVDTLIIGGGMVYTFLKAKGAQVGRSLVEDESLETAESFLEAAKSSSTQVILPKDHVAADAFDNQANTQLIVGDDIPSEMIGMDIGPETIRQIEQIIEQAKTVLWNGPLGVFEMDNFAKGTFSVAKALSKSAAVSIVGGGDSVSAIKKSKLSEHISHISTGGGASLEFLEGKELPGIAALQDK